MNDSQRSKRTSNDSQRSKKTCQFCGDSSYNGKYSQHLQNHHKKEWGVRQLVKSLNSEELEEVKKFIIGLKKVGE